MTPIVYWFRCTVCGYVWQGRKENPKACPECKRRHTAERIEPKTEEGEK